MAVSAPSPTTNPLPAMSVREMKDLLQNAIARPVEESRKIANANAQLRQKEQKAAEAGKGEALDVTA